MEKYQKYFVTIQSSDHIFKRTYIATLNIFYYVFPNKINSLQEVGRSSNIGVDFCMEVLDQMSKMNFFG